MNFEPFRHFSSTQHDSFNNSTNKLFNINVISNKTFLAIRLVSALPNEWHEVLRRRSFRKNGVHWDVMGCQIFSFHNSRQLSLINKSHAYQSAIKIHLVAKSQGIQHDSNPPTSLPNPMKHFGGKFLYTRTHQQELHFRSLVRYPFSLLEFEDE